VSLHSLDSTEPISTMIQSHLFALLCLAPSGASAPIRPAPGAMAAQRSTPSGTSNNLPLPHLSSSVCDEDRRARGYTQSCSSILLSTIPASHTIFHLHIFNPFPHSLWYIGDQTVVVRPRPLLGAHLQASALSFCKPSRYFALSISTPLDTFFILPLLF
jgi:hypothetical protein